MDEFGHDAPDGDTWGTDLGPLPSSPGSGISQSNPFLSAHRIIADPRITYGDVLWYADYLRHCESMSANPFSRRLDPKFVPTYWHHEAMQNFELNRQDAVRCGLAVHAHHVVTAAVRVEAYRRAVS